MLSVPLHVFSLFLSAYPMIVSQLSNIGGLSIEAL